MIVDHSVSLRSSPYLFFYSYFSSLYLVGNYFWPSKLCAILLHSALHFAVILPCLHFTFDPCNQPSISHKRKSSYRMSLQIEIFKTPPSYDQKSQKSFWLSPVQNVISRSEESKFTLSLNKVLVNVFSTEQCISREMNNVIWRGSYLCTFFYSALWNKLVRVFSWNVRKACKGSGYTVPSIHNLGARLTSIYIHSPAAFVRRK
jgi:hypothetical protein